MNGASAMKWEELRQTLLIADKIFDRVRLVDPMKMCEVSLTDDGKFINKKTNCYDLWKQNSKCSNCTSLCSMNQGCVVSKNQRIGKCSYHILSDSIEVVDGKNHVKRLVMEMISQTLEDEEQGNTVLVVDDQEVNRMIIRKILEKDYHVLEAESGKQALSVLDKYNGKIAAVVLDLVMPGLDGYSIMRYIAKDERYGNIPILVTTGETDAENEKKCLEEGAWDFIPKPINKDTLRLRLRNIIGRSQFDYQKHERYLAEHDRLTGLYNRVKFFEQAKSMMEENPNQQYAFIRVDLDRFHLYNSFFGETEGDKLLIYFAKKIKDNAKVFTEAVFGRIEADIFGICCPYQEEGIAKLRDKLLVSLQKYNSTYYIEPSIGVYVVKDSRIPVEGMYDRASMAAGLCKHKFMSEVGYYNECMTDQLLVEQELMNEAQKALDEEQFVVYLQPKTNIHTEEPYGAEALVRWQHPDKGLVSPGKFIPVFESNGFIGRLDYYMWEHTCKLLRKWMDEGLDPAPVSVNVSRANMYNPNLIDNLKGLIDKYQIPASLLQLELTESAFMDDQDMMIDKVKELRGNGFTVLMDDFGSGYSSLNTLKDIPVDILKIDMKFLGTGEGNGRSERILASVVRMASWLDLTVIVEGVETKEQRNFLESIGCEYAQGYYYARPMPWQEYEDALRNPKEYQKITEGRTENHQVVEKIWKRNPELEKSFYTILQPVAIYQYSGKEISLLQANGEFKQSFGYDTSLSSQFEENNKFIPNKYVNRIRSAFEKCVRKKKSAHSDYMRFHDSGETKWYRIKLHYLCTESDHHVIMALFHEVSQEKEMERELEKYRKYLLEEEKRPSKMLIVDDSALSRMAAKELFKDRFEILEAANGMEALEIMKREQEALSIILLDMNMPVMDGAEFLKHKNASKQCADIPIIVISADDSQDTQIELLKNGVNDYVTKPLVPEVVERRVFNVLEYNSRFRNILREYQMSRK